MAVGDSEELVGIINITSLEIEAPVFLLPRRSFLILVIEERFCGIEFIVHLKLFEIWFLNNEADTWLISLRRDRQHFYATPWIFNACEEHAESFRVLVDHEPVLGL